MFSYREKIPTERGKKVNTVKIEATVQLTESEYALVRAIILDAVDSPKYSLSIKNRLDALRLKLSTAALNQAMSSGETISHDIW